jgi:acetyl esterase
LRASAFAALSPTIFVAAEVDPLISEGEAYVAALTAAGVTVDYRLVKGVSHGFIPMHRVLNEAAQTIDFIATSIRSLVGSRQ